MSKDNTKCRICNEESNKQICRRCDYFMKNGATEDSIRRMLSNEEVNKLWHDNKDIADRLAETYYQSAIDKYKKEIREDNKLNFGFNMFAEGINAALDIIMPMLDETSQAKVSEKIDGMIKIREGHNNRKYLKEEKDLK